MRDVEQTKRRLLDAATAEFAERGVAGARVDRIAALAGASKALIYNYFGNKEGLFDAVFAAVVDGVVESVPIDPDDLPGYAGRLFDLYRARPEILRLATWHMLERGPTTAVAAAAAADGEKIATIRDAQRDGRLSDRFDAGEVLALVLGLAMLGVVEGGVGPGDEDAERRRHTVTSAVELLVSDAGNRRGSTGK